MNLILFFLKRQYLTFLVSMSIGVRYLYVFLICHDLCFFRFYFFLLVLIPSALGIGHMMLVHLDGKESYDLLVSAESDFEFLDECSDQSRVR